MISSPKPSLTYRLVSYLLVFPVYRLLFRGRTAGNANVPMEGALVVVFGVPGPGEWEIGDEDTYGSWFFVEEASSIYQSGIVSTSVPMDVAMNLEVSAGGLSLDDQGESSFNFPEDDFSGSFSAEVCNNVGLQTLVNNLLVELALGPGSTVME